MSDIDYLWHVAKDWHLARTAFLALPAGSPDAKAALERLANAEDALNKAVKGMLE